MECFRVGFVSSSFVWEQMLVFLQLWSSFWSCYNTINLVAKVIIDAISIDGFPGISLIIIFWINKVVNNFVTDFVTFFTKRCFGFKQNHALLHLFLQLHETTCASRIQVLGFCTFGLTERDWGLRTNSILQGGCCFLDKLLLGDNISGNDAAQSLHLWQHFKMKWAFRSRFSI